MRNNLPAAYVPHGLGELQRLERVHVHMYSGAIPINHMVAKMRNTLSLRNTVG